MGVEALPKGTSAGFVKDGMGAVVVVDCATVLLTTKVASAPTKMRTGVIESFTVNGGSDGVPMIENGGLYV